MLTKWQILVACFSLFVVYTSHALEIPQSLLNQVEQGNAEAAYFIATQFDQKSLEQPDKDYAQIAHDWMQKAALMAYPQAMFEWAEMLEFDEKQQQALEWYQKAAALNVPDAIDKIALFHLKGRGGLTQDCQTAYQWYAKAQVHEHKLAFNNHAWSLATSPDKQCRNPEKALLLINQLVSLYKQEFVSIPAHVLDTQAAVYAAVSDFNKAIEIQKIAIARLYEDNIKMLAYKQRLQTYEARKAWIETSQE